MVVSYVANAEDQKARADGFNQQLMAGRSRTNQANENLEQAKAQFAQAESNMQKKVSELKAALSKTSSELNGKKAEVSRLLGEADTWTTLTDEFRQTNQQQSDMLKSTLAELDGIRADVVKLEKELDETSRALLEKDAVVMSMQKKVKQLEDEKASLLGGVNQQLNPYGTEAASAATVTNVDRSSTATMTARDIDLKALIGAVDMKNSMAQLSVGSADGVTQGMRFHVTRGREFICDVLIISVDVEQSVGVLELVQQQPMVGDNASTNL